MGKPPNASGTKPSALVLSPEIPYPVQGGGPIRSASILEYLRQHYAVHLITFREAGAPDATAIIPAGCVDRLDVVDLPYHSRHSIARVIRNGWRMVRNRPPLIDRFSGFGESIAAAVSGRRYDLVVIEHFWCAPYVEQLKVHTNRIILDLHNIESVWHRSLAAHEGTAKSFALRRFASTCRKLEALWLPLFDSILVTSAEEVHRIQDLVPAERIAIYPNALPATPAPVRREANEIVFSGNLAYQPNVAAIEYFQERIWPALRSIPGLKWKIIGKNPEAIRRMIQGDDRIELVGPVAEAVPELAAAKVAVVPVVSGSGTRIKILEAWAAGTPVVSTPLGAEGLDFRDGDQLLLAATAEEFIGALARLLNSAEDRARIGASGRRRYEERYTWPTAWKRLDALLGNHESDTTVLSQGKS